MSEEKTLAELAEITGIPARTIRFYISRGLVEGPSKAGRGAVYTPAHIERLEKIKALQSEGRSLAEIGPLLSGKPQATYPSSPWWQHAIADDVIVSTRADASPWRMKLIHEALAELAARLATGGNE